MRGLILKTLGLSLISASLNATPYQLESSSLLSTCPFVHEDAYSFDRLLTLVKSQLQTKLDAQQNCEAPLNNLSANLDVIDRHFKQFQDDSFREEILLSAYNRQLVDLRLEMTVLERDGNTSTPRYQEVSDSIRMLEASVRQTTLDGKLKNASLNADREAEFQSSLFKHIQQVINTLAAAPANCIEHLGGWKQLIGPLVSTAALATGYGAFAHQELAGAALQIAGSLITLFQDQGLKKTILEMTKLQNYKILACTYHAIKYNACEYSRAFQLTENKEKIEDVIHRRYQGSEYVKEYSEYFDLLNKNKDFEGVFNEIAEIGSAVTLDIGLVTAYLQAKQSNPESFALLTEEEKHSDDKMRSWLIEARRRGIYFVDRDYSGPIPLQQQVAQAEENIRQKIADIRALEAILSQNRSFIDIRESLIADNPHIADEVNEVIRYLSLFVTQGDALGRSGLLLPAEYASLHSVLVFLEPLRDFLSVNSNGWSGEDRRIYEETANQKGLEVFNIMAKGTLAQIDSQSVMLLGGKVRERLARAFRMIEQAYLRRDIQSDLKSNESFSQYKLDQSLLFEIIENFAQFTGPGKTFRDMEFTALPKAFRNGFQTEILDMVDWAIETQSSMVPEMKGSTAPHLCSLFNDALPKIKGGEQLLKKCRERFKEIDYEHYLGKRSMKIDYSNTCFYPQYLREVQTQRLLADRYRKSQPLNATTQPSSNSLP